MSDASTLGDIIFWSWLALLTIIAIVVVSRGV